MDKDKQRVLMDFLTRWSRLEPEVCKRSWGSFDVVLGNGEVLFVGISSLKYQSLYLINEAVEARVKARSWELNCELSPGGEFSCELWRGGEPIYSGLYSERYLALLDVYLKTLEWQKDG